MMAKIELSDSEWVSLLDGYMYDSALPVCCGNVSDLRDTIVLILRNGRSLDKILSGMLLEKYDIFIKSHDFDGETLGNLIAQARLVQESNDV